MNRRTRAGRHSAADMDRADRFQIAGIIRIEHADQPAGADIGGDVEQAEPRDAGAGQHHLPQSFAIVDQQIARHRLLEMALIVPKRPGRAAFAEIERQAVMAGQLGGGIGHAFAREVVRRCANHQAAFAQLARDQAAVEQRSDADRHIGARGQQVDRGVGHAQVDHQFRMRGQERRNHRRHEHPAKRR